MKIVRELGGSRLAKALGVGLIAGLVGGLFVLSVAGAAVERDVGLRWLFDRRGPIAPPPEIVVVGIESRTGEQAGLSPLPREWPRSVHGKLVDELTRRGASAIAFDIQFDRPREAADDQVFVDAVARSRRVALIQLITGRRQPVLAPDGRQTGSVWVEGLVEPLEALRAAARAQATFPLPKIDAAVFDFWAFKESLGDAPTLPATMLQLHALSQWTAWRTALESLAVPELSRALSETPEQGPANAEAFSELTLLLRHLLSGNPELAAKLASHIDAVKAPLLGALHAMYSGDPHRTINFYGPPGTIPTIPYQAVLSGESTFDFRDKVVFVGFSDLYDPGQPDRFFTVVTSEDGVDLSGVEIAATAFGNLLTDSSIVTLDIAADSVLLMLFGLLIGALAYYLPALAGVPLVLGLGIAWAVAAQLQFNQQQVWMPIATPLLLQLPLALFLGLIAQYLLERQRRQHANEALSYYVPENIARDLTRTGGNPDAFNRVVYGTCLATDMSGFSTISERLPPDQLALFLNEYFDTLATALRRHNVDITEFRADAIMCAWTSDVPAAAPRLKALLAALAAAEAIEAFKTRHQQLQSALRVGLQCGTFYVGHAGGGGHFVFSIVGDTANTASRLESLNKHLGTSVLAGGEVVAGLEDRLLLRPLGDFRLMGKGENIGIVEVVATQQTARAEQRARVAEFAPVLDAYRNADLALAVAALEEFQSRYPDDGPTRFLLRHAAGLLASGRTYPAPRAVEMDSK